MPETRLQVLIADSPDDALVAGLPPALRTAHRASQELAPAKMVLCSADTRFAGRWSGQLAGLEIPPTCANGQPARSLLEPDSAVLVLSAEGFPEAEALKSFLDFAAPGKPARWVHEAKCVAAYYPSAAGLIKDSMSAAFLAKEALRYAQGPEFRTAGWLDAGNPESVRRAEQGLYASLAKNTDGYIARFDRRLSIALSAALLRTPATPNMITTASLALGLLGAWGLASGSYGPQLAGALLLWFCCILDGCDGEVARLKLLCSPSGAAYDLAADQVAHLATFVAIPVGIHRMHPEVSFLVPGVLLVTGFLACMFSVWWLVLRLPQDKRGPYALLIERVASRDYVYLILALVAVGKLEWFLWAAALGSHGFYLGLWWLSGRAKAPTA